jgi:hypothetical protein
MPIDLATPLRTDPGVFGIDSADRRAELLERRRRYGFVVIRDLSSRGIVQRMEAALPGPECRLNDSRRIGWGDGQREVFVKNAAR